MKKIIEEQRMRLLQLNQDVGFVKDSQIHAAFDAISNELGFVIARIDADARKIDQAVEKLPKIAEMMKRFAGALRSYCDRLTGEKVEESKIILLPGSDARSSKVSNGS